VGKCESGQYGYELVTGGLRVAVVDSSRRWYGRGPSEPVITVNMIGPPCHPATFNTHLMIINCVINTLTRP